MITTNAFAVLWLLAFFCFAPLWLVRELMKEKIECNAIDVCE